MSIILLNRRDAYFFVHFNVHDFLAICYKFFSWFCKGIKEIQLGILFLYLVVKEIGKCCYHVRFSPFFTIK